MNEEIESYIEWYNNFLKQYKSIVNQDIKEWTKIEEIVKFFAQSKQKSLADYIDSSWLDIDTMSFDSRQKRIHIVHNKISQGLPPEDLNIQLSIWGAHHLCADFFVDCIRIVGVNKWPVLLLKTQYKDQKELNLFYNTRCQKCNIRKYNVFSVEVFRTISENKKIISENTIIPNVNCFTVAIFPKILGRKIKTSDSEKNLLDVNEKEFEKFFSDGCLILKDLLEKDVDEEGIKDFGNRIRRKFENYLKICRIRNSHYLRKDEGDCQKLMLGDLVSELLVKNLPSNCMKIEDIVQKLNECSHDSGVNVSVDDLFKVLASLIIIYSEEGCARIARDLKEKGIVEDEEESLKKELQKKKYDERKKFIINNACSWNLKQILQKKWIRRNIKFYFCLKENITSFLGEKEPRFYLSKKGYLMQYSAEFFDEDIPLDDCYFVYDRRTVLDFVNRLKNKINNILEENDFEPLGGIGYDLSVSFVMCKKSRRLFSKKEVDRVVRNADDSVDNWLVVDECGHLCVVQTNQDLYPVLIERWPRNCGYFGKLVSEKHLAEVYSFALSGYLSYLTTGTSEYVDFDYIGGSDEEKIKKIKELIEPRIFKIAKKFFLGVLTLFRLKKHDNK